MPRLFFALWPDEAARDRLATLAGRLAAQLAGKPVPAEKIHLTLAFLGEVGGGDARARDAATAIRSRAFEARFDQVGSFRGAKVAWAGAGRPADALLELQSTLESSLRAAGFDLEERPFRPHMTLVRRISRTLAPGRIEPIAWTAREFSLVRSDTSTGRYERVDDWNLGI